MRNSYQCRALKVPPVTRCRVCAVIDGAIATAVITTVVTAIILIVRCVGVVGIVVGAK